jgi:DNA-binding response OmpR family regulator
MPQEPTTSVLLIEDDEKLATLTRQYLEQQGLIVTVENHGVRGLDIAGRQTFDVVLLDIMLPGMDGIEVCRRLRQRRDVPIIMLTARGEEADRVLGLELGADDYMTKPFSPRELLARIRALVRRRRGMGAGGNPVLTIGSLIIDSSRRQAVIDNRDLALTSYEFALLYALAENHGRVLSRERLMDLAKGSADEAFDRSIDVHISRLRKKLSDDPKRPAIIKTVRGAGYQLTEATKS